MKILPLLLCLLCVGFMAKATHIFGGDLSMTRVNNANKFKVGLTVYIDEKFASTSSRNKLNSYQTLAVYRKRDNTLVESFRVLETPLESIVYDECGAILGVQTTKYYFEVQRDFNPDLYKDQLGYYLTWQDCCRNQAIVNANSSGTNTGMSFFLQFPAMIDASGKPFVNSSPLFNFVDGQVICANENASIDFGAKDLDGDRLEFKLVTPYSTYGTASSNKDVAPGPIRIVGGEFPLISWRPGYSENNMISGSIPLRIDSKTGNMTVNSSEIGPAFVIAVEVKEYRNNVLIGIVRRDYQFQVTECSPPPPPPLVYDAFTPTELRDKGITTIDFCEDGFVLLDTKQNSQYSYQWSKDGIDLSGENTYQLRVTAPGKYVVKIADKGKCGKKSSSELITVGEKIGEEVAIKSDLPSPICNDKKINLTVNRTGINYRYLWFVDEDTLKAFQTQTIRALKSGKYKVILTNVVSKCYYDPTINIKINPIPDAKFTNSKNIKVACDGGTLPLKAKEGQGYSFDFFLNGISIAKKKTADLDAKKTGTYHYFVTDENGCSVNSDSIKLLFNPSPSPLMDSIPTSCGTSNKRINLNGRPLNGIYTGRGIDQNGVFDPTLSGFGLFKIVYTVTNEYKCTRLTARYINIAQTPRVILGSDLSIIRGDSVKILGSASTDATLMWSPATGLSNASIINPVASPQNTTKYVLKALFKNGCAAEGDVLVTVFPNLKIPTGITPNGDGINDTFAIEGIDELPECDVEIYSRWGEKVFSSRGYSIPFDGTHNGTPLPVATYYYVIKPNNGGSHFKGTLAILK